MQINKNDSFALLGFGISNRAVADYLTHIGVKNLTVRSRTPVDSLPLGCRCVCGDGWLDGLCESVLIRSPSVRPDLPPIANAVRRGAKLTSDAEIFLRSTNDLTFGVTGSDGKSTTASMTAELLRRGKFPRARLGGNIGVALTSFLFPPVIDNNATVCELSSFQLQDTPLPLARACITNITPNHLNWHTDMGEYIRAKHRIFEECTHPVVYVGGETVVPDVGATVPKHVFALCTDGKHMRTGRLPEAEHLVVNGDDRLTADGETLLEWSEFAPKGRHNRINFTLAVAMTLGFVDGTHIRSVARSFTPLAHRMQTVAALHDIEFVDSSVDSSPSRTAVTLSCMDRPTLLLLGGDNKNLSYDCLIPFIEKHCHSVFLWGEAGRAAAGVMSSPKIPFRIFSGMREAFLHAAGEAKNGQTVLLSPAATSFDEFRDYRERGDVFCRLARDFVEKCK